ncbi:hypothetical protein P280DRAFT_407278 [Massarina eburnea CBS 473.64]|uniref:Uncharacterized protein n=1 Tax=Massarina eburnea CBS 473.64 TaxID=1395130 RepID=A0A6A6RR53_9PLEO|nr:hypothetical protein P280DRAFT_407278 [Massarina eburnea CBS 473.64]
MASNTSANAEPEAASLMGVPLEIRHMIFSEASARDFEPKHVLRHWFERKDVEEQIAAIIASNPTGPTPVGAYHDVEDETETEDEAADDEQDEQDEDDDEDEDAQDNGDEGEDDGGEAQDGQEEDEQNDQGEGEEEMDEGQDQEDDVQDDGPLRPLIYADQKWRHVSKFLRITRTPPPVELFLINKELSVQTKKWFYDAVILKVDATGSFGHEEMYKLALNSLAEAAFSPMEHIKKAEVTFVWDTTWIREQGNSFYGNVFPVLLEQRTQFVLQILQQAPKLQQLVIHWHDSAEDDGSITLMNDICCSFLELKANVTVDQHLIAADVTPHRKSTIGRRRVEFQGIVDRNEDAF